MIEAKPNEAIETLLVKYAAGQRTVKADQRKDVERIRYYIATTDNLQIDLKSPRFVDHEAFQPEDPNNRYLANNMTNLEFVNR